MSNKDNINNLREKLNKSIEKNEDYSLIYDLSVELDKLIAEYYENDIQKEDNQKNAIFFKNIWQF